MKLVELIGLEKIKQLAADDIAMSLLTGRPFPHTLVYGRGGLGKTELALALAEETKQYPFVLKPAEITSPSGLVSLMDVATQTSQTNNQKLFLVLDEIHQLSEIVQESFYDLMKRWVIEVDRGLNKKYYKPFTLFGTTTDYDQLDENSFVARFQNVWSLEPYSAHDLAKMMYTGCFMQDPVVHVTMEALCVLARAALGIPRTALKLAEKAKAHAVARNLDYIASKDAKVVLKKNGIDSDGLTSTHRRYLEVLSAYEQDTQMACPLNWFVAKLSSNQGTVMRLEEELIRQGLICKTPRGRQSTRKGQKRLGVMLGA